MAKNARSSDYTDTELIELLHRRDERALAAAYDRYGTVVFSMLVRITRNPSIAEDLLQEVFLRVWTNARRFDCARGSLYVWILWIARNLAIDHLRSAEQRMIGKRRSTEHLESICCCPNQTNSVVSGIAVREAFAKLTASQQRVLELAYFEGCSQSEIAARLHEPLGTVKSWMRSALISMREAIEKPVDNATRGAAEIGQFTWARHNRKNARADRAGQTGP